MHPDDKKAVAVGAAGIVTVLLFILFQFSTTVVDKGEVKVGYRFGDYKQTLQPGFHFVNPFTDFTVMDTKKQSRSEPAIRIPSKDQQTSTVDASIQYRLDPAMAQIIVSEIGGIEALEAKHMIPKLEAVVRQAGRSLEVAEDLYNEGEVERISMEITEEMRRFLKPKGAIVEAVFLKNVDLPEFIEAAIQQKKVRVQKAEEEEAELERFKTEQEQKVAAANAELDAARAKAEQVKALADAKAYEIQKLNEAIANNPAYIQLESINALKAMSRDPAAKLYFMDSNSVNPIPLMNIGADLQRSK